MGRTEHLAVPSDDRHGPPTVRSQKQFSNARQKVLRKTLAELQFEDACGTTPAAPHRRKAFPVEDLAWPQFQSVNLQHDLVRDADHTFFYRHSAMAWASSWVLPLVIGLLTAATGTLIEIGSEFLNQWRYSYPDWQNCTLEQCQWVPWAGEANPMNWRRFGAYVLFSVLLATSSAVLVKQFAPAARGSGIPEVKTILGGFVMKDTLSTQTLVVKVIGLMLSVSSGLALGKEGPTVHIACCWANVCSGFSARYSNESRFRELLSVASAAGVSVAFGAPVGGVLFSYEEVSTRFPKSTMIRAFFAAVVAALALSWYDILGTGKLTLFEVYYPQEPALAEYPVFLLMGCLGGLVGASFVHLNMQVSELRKDGSAFRRRVPITVEVALIALVTAITSYPSEYTRGLSNLTIHSLFHSCENGDSNVNPLTLCNDDKDSTESALVLILLLAAAVRFAQVTVTFGTGMPCGLFVPSLYVGACLGRGLGVLTAWANSYCHFADDIHPGIYAMVGAASVLGGVCRVTISLVVIMFELTGGLYLILPFMIAVLAAKWVGDIFNHSIYECVIHLRRYPFLNEPCEITYSARACDVMQEDLHCVALEASVETVLHDAREAPFVNSSEDLSVVGYVLAKPLQEFLEEQLSSSRCYADSMVSFHGTGGSGGCLDASKLVDTSVLLVVPDTPASQIHSIFRHVGSKLIMVTKLGKLVGIITKKSFLKFLSEGLEQNEDKTIAAVPPVQIKIEESEVCPYVDAYCRQASHPAVAFPERCESLTSIRQEVVQDLQARPLLASRPSVLLRHEGKAKSRLSHLVTIHWPEERHRSQPIFWGSLKSFLDMTFLPVVIGFVTAIVRCLLLLCCGLTRHIYHETDSFTYVLLISLPLTQLSASLSWCSADCSGCGMPEVKTILNGFVMDEMLSFQMFLFRFLGLILTATARLCLDFVGVLMHLAACCSDLCCRLDSIRNEAVRREMISVACAAGISAGFGTPLGGVLWSLELSSQFPQQTLISAFLAAIVADLVLKANIFNTSIDVLREMKEVGSSYKHLPSATDQVLIAMLGLMGGLLGAGCVLFNMYVCRLRSRYGWSGPTWRGRLYIAMVTCLSCTAFSLEPLLQVHTDALEALFRSCQSGSKVPQNFGLCHGSEPVHSTELAMTLLRAGSFFWLELILTYDSGVPGGYYIPSFFIGACMGRGICTMAHCMGLFATVHPGIYAMVGAAAVMAGTCRVHVSLVVIMFELTGALQLVIPFMVCIMAANWLGNFLTCSMDHCHIHLRGYPHLESTGDVVLKSHAYDIMDEALECLTCDPCHLSEFSAWIEKAEYGGFPVVLSEDCTLLGYASREGIRDFLRALPVRITRTNPLVSFQPRENMVDLSSLVDRTVLQIVPEMRLEQVHQIFLELGAKLVLVSRFGKLVGMITKKAFVDFLSDGDIGNIQRDPVLADQSDRPTREDLEQTLLK
ncbi:unnamed protein product [Cladocopium goreaui]|uniref:Chloride channel protein n=1 Tax=Cladocopium goreaui TaxID=2562237 RepID=A0A9P1BS52_9DINO|nr:unnamed protein product [Cladocopium goreaui]